MSGGGGRPGGGFTLIELLVVILIILLVSAVVLPTVLPAISHRQVSEAARILQGALAGARDTAINNNAPAGIRLLPDPVLNGQSLNAPVYRGASTLDPTRILASNRYVPIQLAPDYSEGLVSVGLRDLALAVYRCRRESLLPYPAARARRAMTYYPAGTGHDALPRAVGLQSQRPREPAQLADLLVLEHPDWRQDPDQQHGDLLHRRRPHEQSDEPRAVRQRRPPGTTPPLLSTTAQTATTHYPEFLFLVNGLDDNNDGYVDNGWDGIDNDGDGIVDQVTRLAIANLASGLRPRPGRARGITSMLAPRTFPTPSPAGRWCRRAPARRRCHRMWWST